MVRSAGDTFIIKIVDGGHLWVAITTPIGAKGSFVAVNMTSVKDGHPFDDSCIVLPGEHPFVRMKTEMYYLKAREWQVSGFDSLSSYGGSCAPDKPVSKILLSRIQQGALKSHHMKDRFQELVRKEIMPP